MTEEHRQPRRRSGWAPADLGSYVGGLANAVYKGMAEEVAPYDLTPLEFSLLKICMEEGERTATQLAEVLPTDASRISRMVTKLVNLGLLRRRRLANDRRVVKLRITEKGRELTSEAWERVQGYDAKLTEGVNDEEMDIFISICFKILANYATMEEYH